MRKHGAAKQVLQYLDMFRLVAVMSAMLIIGIIPGGGTAKTDQGVQSLIQERTELVAELGALLDLAKSEQRTLTDEEKETADGIQAKIDGLKGTIALMDQQRENQRDIETANLKTGANDNVEGTPYDVDGAQVFKTNPNTPDGGPYASMGHQMQDIRLAALGGREASAAIERLEQVTAFHEDKFRADAQGAGIAIDSDGGFLVQTTFSSEIMRKMHDTGVLLGGVRRIPIASNTNGIKLPMVDESSRADGSRMGGIRGYWVEEGEAPTATKGTFAQLHLELKKVAALGYATSELLENAPAMAAFFTDAFAEELRFKVEDAIFEGDGAGKPQGLTEANAVISVSKETGQAAATIVHENLIKMWARLWARSRANSIWYYNQDIEPQLDELAKTIGTAGVEPSYVTYAQDGSYRIKGRPAMPIEYASTLGTVDDIVLADLGAYFLIDNGGINQAQSIHVRFTTDETAFRATYRVDGGSSWKEALTPFKGTNTQSPFITLATRG